MKKIFIGNDHAAYEVKKAAVKFLESAGCEVVDLGCHSAERADYPDFAEAVCKRVLANEGAFGVLICGTGIGMSVAANKINGVRAALAHDTYTAAMARAHNDANVLCFGARVVGLGVMESILEAWLGAHFEGGRHADRVAKIAKLES